MIFGIWGFPALGIRGAAIATTSAMILQMVWSLWEAAKEDSVKIRIIYLFRIDKNLRDDFIRYSAPIAGNYLFYGLGVTMYSVIIGHMGENAVAANSIAVIVRNLISCVSKGIASAGAILVGNDLGRDAYEEAKLHAGIVTRFAAGCGVVSGAVMLGIRPLILDFVMLTQTANGYLSDMLFICCIYMFFISVNSTVIGGIFCAGGKSKFGCICDAVTLWCLVIPAAAFGAFYFKLPVIIVYLILCLDEVIKIPIVFWYFKCYSWVQNITRQSS